MEAYITDPTITSKAKSTVTVALTLSQKVPTATLTFEVKVCDIFNYNFKFITIESFKLDS